MGARITLLKPKPVNDDDEEMALMTLRRRKHGGGFQFFPARGWTPGARDALREQREEQGLPT